jgi:flavorubredoxin
MTAASLPLKGGGQLRCISAPYLHSPGNMVMYDSVSGFLFSGDIGAAVFKDGKLRLVIEDWSTHVTAMQGFHQRYMSSNRAVSGFIRKIDGLPITAILPQHGSMFRGDEVAKFLRWSEQLPVGVDYLYVGAR